MTLLNHKKYRVIQYGTLYIRGKKVKVGVGDILELSPDEAKRLIRLRVVERLPTAVKVKDVEIPYRKSFKVG